MNARNAEKRFIYSNGVLLAILGAIISMVLLASCGNQQAQELATMAAEKAIGVYIEEYVGDINIEDVKVKLMEKKDQLPSMALDKFFTDESVKDLAFKARVERSVLLAVSDALGMDPKDCRF